MDALKNGNKVTEEEYVVQLVLLARDALCKALDFVKPDESPESFTTTFDAQDSCVNSMRILRYEKELWAARRNGNLEEFLSRIGFLQHVPALTICKCLDELHLKRLMRLEFEAAAGIIPPTDYDEYAPSLEDLAQEKLPHYKLQRITSPRGHFVGMVMAADWTGFLLHHLNHAITEIPFRRLAHGQERPKAGDLIVLKWRDSSQIQVTITKSYIAHK